MCLLVNVCLLSRLRVVPDSLGIHETFSTFFSVALTYKHVPFSPFSFHPRRHSESNAAAEEELRREIHKEDFAKMEVRVCVSSHMGLHI